MTALLMCDVILTVKFSPFANFYTAENSCQDFGFYAHPLAHFLCVENVQR